MGLPSISLLFYPTRLVAKGLILGLLFVFKRLQNTEVGPGPSAQFQFSCDEDELDADDDPNTSPTKLAHDENVPDYDAFEFKDGRAATNRANIHRHSINRSHSIDSVCPMCLEEISRPSPWKRNNRKQESLPNDWTSPWDLMYPVHPSSACSDNDKLCLYDTADVTPQSDMGTSPYAGFLNASSAHLNNARNHRTRCVHRSPRFRKRALWQYTTPPNRFSDNISLAAGWPAGARREVRTISARSHIASVGPTRPEEDEMSND